MTKGRLFLGGILPRLVKELKHLSVVVVEGDKTRKTLVRRVGEDAAAVVTPCVDAQSPVVQPRPICQRALV